MWLQNLPMKAAADCTRPTRQTARACFSNGQPMLCMKPAESSCWNLKWGFLHLPNNLTRTRLWSSSSVFPALCRNSHPGCSWTKMFRVRACIIKLGPADQGLCSASALTSTLRTNPGISEFLRFMWTTWKLLHRGQELQAKCLKVFVGRLHTPLLVTREAAAGLD